jgi:hypothetical protein
MAPQPTVEDFRWRSLQLPKEGNSEVEYEDAFAVNLELGRFAIADGASESIFAGEWSRLLTQAFVESPMPQLDWDVWLPPLRAQWFAQTLQAEQSWYAQEKVDIGAFATFLGFELTERIDRGQKWRAVAVGDSCLFQVRRGRMISSFPIYESSEFSTRPALVGSRPQSPSVSGLERTAIGMLMPGDMLFLTTDAMGQWFLSECEASRRPWVPLMQMDPDIFSLWVGEERTQKRLKNDDLTVVMMELKSEKS